MRILLNDVHSRLNPTELLRVCTPATEGELLAIVEQAQRHS